MVYNIAMSGAWLVLIYLVAYNAFAWLSVA